MGSGDTSSKVNAFVGDEAQTSYQCQTFSDNFLIQDDAARAYVAECKSDAKNKYDPLFRNALAARVRKGDQFIGWLDFVDAWRVR